MKNKKIRNKDKAKKVLKNDPKLGKVYQSGKFPKRVVLQDSFETAPYDARNARQEEDDDINVAGAIVAGEIIVDAIEAIVDNTTTDIQQNTEDFSGFGGGETGGGGATSDY